VGQQGAAFARARGLPDLEGNLSRRAHRSLLTRIHHRFLLAPATVEDTAEYVRYRLGAAGTDRALFPDDAIATLHEQSQGALREIDRLATAARSASTGATRTGMDGDAGLAVDR
jgi:type II secretory pathway predicted ATPase ExeA